MLRIILKPRDEIFDESSGKFLPSSDGFVIELEHSLVAVSKWESKWEIPFLSTENKTAEQTIDYIRCMIVGDEIPPEVFSRISGKEIKLIQEYISSKQSATWITEKKRPGPSPEIVTSELIYYWMIAHEIPVEFESWHLSRLLTLIKVCNVKNAAASEEKMSPKENAEYRRALNEQRKKQLGTNG